MAKLVAIEVATITATILLAMQSNFAANAPGITTIITAILMGTATIIAAWAALKLKMIEAHVNSEKTADKGVIASLRQENVLLLGMMEQMNLAASLLAQAKSTSELTQAMSQAAVAGATAPATPVLAQTRTPVLAAIEQNTKDTVENTKKTDDTIQEIKKDA